MALTADQITRLSHILASTLSDADLQAIIVETTGDRSVEAFQTGPSLRQTIVNLLTVLNGRNTTLPVFLAGVYHARPKRQDVRDAIRELCPEAAQLPDANAVSLSLQDAGRPVLDAAKNAFAPGFEGVVRPQLPAFNPLVWMKDLSRTLACVCRIDFDQSALGTGFVVGDDTVLTNWHVVEAALAQQGGAARLSCLFDFKQNEIGATSSGNRVRVRDDGVLDRSSYSPAEKTRDPETPPPTAQELDYALLQLERPTSAERGWIWLPDFEMELKPGAALIIPQHPSGEPLQMAMDTNGVIGFKANGLRLRYNTNTKHGSSGSPCLTMDLKAIALHHYGDPKWPRPQYDKNEGDPELANYNQGIPLWLIRRLIEARGFGAHLGGAVQPVAKSLERSFVDRAVDELTVAAQRIDKGGLKLGIKTYRTNYADALSSITRLNAYKGLHDLLHNVQSRPFFEVKAAMMANPPDQQQSDIRLEFRSKLRTFPVTALGVIEDLKADPRADYGYEVTWIHTFEGSATACYLALQRGDLPALDDALDEIEHCLRFHPTRLDGLISTAAATLGPSLDTTTIRQAATNLAEAIVDATQTFDAVDGLGKSILAETNAHTLWQAASRDIVVIEDTFDSANQNADTAGLFAKFGKHWGRAKKNVGLLLAAAPRPSWAAEMEALMAEVDNSLSTESIGKDLIRAFNAFRNLARDEFLAADARLKIDFTQLKRLNTPLSRLLEAAAK